MKTYVIIAEKPTAAKKIASSIFNKPKEKELRGIKYYEAKLNGNKFIIVPSVGHLFVLSTSINGWQYPVFDVQWIPSFMKKSASFSKAYFENLKEILAKADAYIIATDYDVEGEVIGYNIVKMLGNGAEIYRMRFSTLTKEELKKAFENLMKGYDVGLAEAGLARHYLDFYWGVNLTRALTKSLKQYENLFKILSVGRVQGPTLALLAKKEKEISSFKPKPYWQFKIKLKIANRVLEAELKGKKKFWKKEEAEKILQEIKKAKLELKSIKTKQKQVLPPVPYNTTDLQIDAYQYFGFTPAQTLQIAESLYQQGYISYPRSSSQKLPASIGFKNILKALAKLKPYANFSKELLAKAKLVPTEGKKDDPAHPAIYPTAEVPNLAKLNARERKLYDLIVRRFLAVFGEPATREVTTLEIKAGKALLVVKGKKTVKQGWLKYYQGLAKIDEVSLPNISSKTKISLKKIELLEKQTEPPKRYSPASIIKEMEARGLGTKATRAEILQTLYQRNYIKGKSINVTHLGLSVVQALEKYCPEILSEELTRKFENLMEEIREGKAKREEVLKQARKLLEKILAKMKKNEKKIAKDLAKALRKTWDNEKYLGICPSCNGNLVVIKSKASGKLFVGCSNYPNCKNAYPLPQYARIEKTNKVCEHCNTPIIKVMRKGKRPFSMCLDPKCKTKESWA